jgi:hypothetical protein
MDGTAMAQDFNNPAYSDVLIVVYDGENETVPHRQFQVPQARACQS